jgi:glutamyl/glutaminyl-tRNA synthetase
VNGSSNIPPPDVPALETSPGAYRGRLAPSPTGFLHLGHARTFWIAQARARARGGTLILRNEDLDRTRVRTEYVAAMLEDLRWFGLEWQEGPDRGGPCSPYSQSERLDLFRNAFARLRDHGLVYPCSCSRQDVLRALQAPHVGEDEPVYPGTCRPQNTSNGGLHQLQATPSPPGEGRVEEERPIASNSTKTNRSRVNWRFRVPDGETIRFQDGCHGEQSVVAGVDFGDFVVWRHDDLPSYQLSVVVDDALMAITEVVRGEDLLRSTARQLLLYRALGWTAPQFYHCPLLTDAAGVRLAKRHDSLSLRELRAQGAQPDALRQEWDKPTSPE